MDAFLLGLALYGAHAFRAGAAQWDSTSFPSIRPIQAFYPLFVFVLGVGPFILDARKIYRFSLLHQHRDFLIRLAQGLFWIVVLMTFLIYVLRLGDLARGVVLLFAFFAFGLIGIRHIASQTLFDFYFHGRKAPPGVLLVGEPSSIDQFRRRIESQREIRMSVLGTISRLDQLEQDVAEWLHRAPITSVIFSVPHTAFEEIQKAIHVCEMEGVEAWIIADHLQSNLSPPVFENFQSLPVLVFASRDLPGWQVVAKRTLDVVIAFSGMVLLLPLMALIALVIRLESPGPVLFVQPRSGRHGRVFRMFKFRSMTSNAEMLQAELEAFNEMSGPVFKLKKDPRVTRFGTFLRRTSLDELPQLWNVLMGDMSLVGPRPLPVYETEKIHDWAHRRRLSVKPGLTCYWQIEGRSRIHNFEEWVRLDLEYVDNWSFWMDLRILIRTIPVVLTGFGAR